MNIADVTTLISNVGFPIVCVIMLWQTTQKQTEAHRAEMEKLTESIHNNTLALTELTTYFKVKGGNEK